MIRSAAAFTSDGSLVPLRQLLRTLQYAGSVLATACAPSWPSAPKASAGTSRSIDAILAFEQERLRAEGSDVPIPDFHHCVFVGLIQDGGERIGCLLHPLALGNGGVDWRGLSFYGGAACKYFFCPDL